MSEKEGLFQQLHDYSKGDHYPYHMPGHKRHQLGRINADILGLDITEIDGFDNLHQAEGILYELQEKANQLYGAEETFYLINGSTAGVLSAVSAALPKGGHLLMARNCHRSAYHAAYLRTLQITYLYPERVEGCDFCEAVTAEQVEQALQKESDIQAVLIVSPTYEGRIADIRTIAQTVHERGIPLIVDEAHGAHLGFAEGFASGSCTAGADLVIHSVHKTLPAMTQTALLHVNGILIDRERLKRFLRIYQSSSPSYLLMASIGDAMEVVEQRGQELFRQFRESYKAMSEQLQCCQRLRFIPWQDVEDGRQDIGKLVIITDRAGVSGQWLLEELRDKYHLQGEMAAGNYCLAMFTIADEKSAYERMAQALLEIDRNLDGEHREAFKEKLQESSEVLLQGRPGRGENCTEERKDFLMPRPQIMYPMATAWDMPWEMTELSLAVNCPVADFIGLYPPGVPMLVPGEILTEEMYELIVKRNLQGLNLQGISVQDGHIYVKVLKG